jgi:hypothetical protein
MRQAQARLQSDAELSKWIYVKDLERIACHPKTTAKMLEELLLHEEKSVHAKAFKNSNLLRFIAEVWSAEMLNSMEWYPLSLIAEKMDTPTSVLEKFAQCSSRAIQRETRNNPNANKQVIEWWQKSSGYVDGDLERWLQDENTWLEEWAALPVHSRLTILTHPKVPIGILAKAFRSEWWVERCAIAQNPSTPRSICQRVAEDGNWVVRAAARETLSR